MIFEQKSFFTNFLTQKFIESKTVLSEKFAFRDLANRFRGCSRKNHFFEKKMSARNLLKNVQFITSSKKTVKIERNSREQIKIF